MVKVRYSKKVEIKAMRISSEEHVISPFVFTTYSRLIVEKKLSKNYQYIIFSESTKDYTV